MATGVPPGEIVAATRARAPAARARQMAMYLAHVGYAWPLARVGLAFGRDRTTASHACHLIEDLRDDQGFDAVISELETCLRTAPESARPLAGEGGPAAAAAPARRRTPPRRP
ncbi:MAG: helix-turn-helix domain-containing protein [Caulobacteraceae bacterium]